MVKVFITLDSLPNSDHFPCNMREDSIYILYNDFYGRGAYFWGTPGG